MIPERDAAVKNVENEAAEGRGRRRRHADVRHELY